ncbi:3-oxoacyl-ACP synthase III [Aeoliella mucimassa]|uniref:3-oxoacyl-[acyl-carrier-protein] synthase 3 n=1 Tax=Aeoliella mucimassa TaxID=2527972 RepID=A0A518AR04_9BACT|nr:3-oxoacyl-ACP synthase III [Aeoliella mucimassa]QDU57161.1 3-oxoacyl-[acyl-carrier-protein] synthase 3 [Aeoliella mucimassa]
MQYSRVCIESLGYTLPAEVVTTASIEQQLAPVYQRLKLPEGRLELMTGIAERRFYAPQTRPSTISIQSARRALEASGLAASDIGALVHGSVCRDFLEPATACRVHHELGLPDDCVIYDLSNACLGLLNGIVQVANMIELGQIEAGLVVGTESGRNLVEGTIAQLNADMSLTRNQIKLAVASLTIGSASAAFVLTSAERSQTGNRLLGGAVHCRTQHHGLCQSDGHVELMQTDSEALMNEGIATGKATFERFKQHTGWTPDDIDRTFCHQVGVAHRKLLFAALELDPAIDYATLEVLGNTGSAALPITMARGLEERPAADGEKLALLGIGSGINCVMLGCQWYKTQVAGGIEQITAQ